MESSPVPKLVPKNITAFGDWKRTIAEVSERKGLRHSGFVRMRRTVTDGAGRQLGGLPIRQPLCFRLARWESGEALLDGRNPTCLRTGELTLALEPVHDLEAAGEVRARLIAAVGEAE